MLEKRKFVRIKTPIGIVYKVIKKHKRQRQQSSFIDDLSASGLSLAVKEVLRRGDLLDMEIYVPHLCDPVHAVGEVIWFLASGNKSGDASRAGVRFCDVEPSDSKHILEYIHAIGIG